MYPGVARYTFYAEYRKEVDAGVYPGLAKARATAAAEKVVKAAELPYSVTKAGKAHIASLRGHGAHDGFLG